MSTPVKPLNDRVVAIAEEASNKTAAGFYLPENAKEKSKISKVVAVGKEVKDVRVGDRIVYGGYSSTELKVEGTEYIIIKEEDIVATLA